MVDFGGNLITCAFDITAKVWSPANYLGECLLGELKGHNHPISNVTVLPKQPFIITIDAQNIVIIWDVRSLFNLNIIRSDEKVDPLVPCGLLALSKNIFWSYGFKFRSFDCLLSWQNKMQQKRQQIEDQQPLDASFNPFHNNIVV